MTDHPLYSELEKAAAEYDNTPIESRPVITTFSRGHTDDCWKWHHECARAEIMFLKSYIEGINKYVNFLEDLIEGSGQPLPDYKEKDEYPW